MSGWLFGWFVSRITQKLLNKFPRNFDRRWISAQIYTPLTFGVDPDKQTDPGIVFSLTLTLQGHVC